MANSQQFWQWLADVLEIHNRAVLLLIVASQGSSPGKSGAKMAVAANGKTIGTIGGGAVEQELLQQAQSMLNAENSVPRLCREMHHPSNIAHQSGQICGGEQTVLLYPFDRQDINLIQQLAQAAQQRQSVLLTFNVAGASLSHSDLKQPLRQFIQHGENWQYQEFIGQPNRAYIIGGGHVSLALSQVLSLLEFDVIVIEERHDVATLEANHYALEKLILPYEQITEVIETGVFSYVFIMTHSHQTDQQVLAQLLGKSFAYLGMLGSRRKIQQIRENLATQFSAEVWENLHAPLGLKINSQTPMEIAMSIAAELIQFKYK